MTSYNGDTQKDTLASSTMASLYTEDGQNDILTSPSLHNPDLFTPNDTSSGDPDLIDPRLDLTLEQDFADALDFINKDLNITSLENIFTENLMEITPTEEPFSENTIKNPNATNFIELNNSEETQQNENFVADQDMPTKDEIIWGIISLDSEDEEDTAIVYFNDKNLHSRTWSSYLSQYGATFYNPTEIESCLKDCVPKENAKLNNFLEQKRQKLQKIVLIRNFYKMLKATKGLMKIFAGEVCLQNNCRCEMWLDIFLPIIQKSVLKLKKAKIIPRHILRKHKRQLKYNKLVNSNNQCYFKNIYSLFKMCYEYYHKLYDNVISKRATRNYKNFKTL